VELRNILEQTPVGELTLTERPTLEPSDTVASAAERMRQASHGSVFVCQDDLLVGIFTERDLLRCIGGSQDLSMPLADVMSADPQTLTTGDSLLDAVRLMDEGGYRRLPIVDSEGTPVGIVDVKTVVHFLVEHFPAAIYNQASHAQTTAKNREGA